MVVNVAGHSSQYSDMPGVPANSMSMQIKTYYILYCNISSYIINTPSHFDCKKLDVCMQIKSIGSGDNKDGYIIGVNLIRVSSNCTEIIMLCSTLGLQLVD